MSVVIEIKNATKKFGNNIIFDDVNLKVTKGTIVGIVGHNGSGKSILFKIICGLIPLSQGRVVVRDKIIGKDIDFPPNIGVIIETPGFLPYLNGFQNLNQLASINNKIDTNRIYQVLELVGLSKENKASVSTYSLGMRQRLGIAQAIMEFPDILILDEPFNGLDKVGVASMRELIIYLRDNGTTILLASHQSNDIDLLCSEVYEFREKNLIKLDN